MSQKIAIAVIHGMGSQGAKPPNSHEIVFSHHLFHGLRQILGHDFFHNVIWREIFWADVLQDRQAAFQDKMLNQEQARWPGLRDFAMSRLADAAAYRRGAGDNGSWTYQEIHQRVAATMAELERMGGGDTPLLVFAHSLGGHILSNYIYDQQSGKPVVPADTSFQRFETLTHFVTFGCNMPLFTFNEPEDRIRPIDYPGARVSMRGRANPWWFNYNDRDDFLGMPLAPSSPNYAAMADSGALQERWINTRPLVRGMTPLSHNLFWKDRNFHKLLEPMLKAAAGAEIAPVQQNPAVQLVA
ncbi:hypothetical protein GFB49_00845 [Epibacterium sp. SM1979]|uniref:Alpha/beta hydrolase family protein n=1 Tax=Tritonibacter litoralis TaxID=2662264 RepID=A0A843YCD5_9RHOB|nr:hypothetical protein [Tritonibacter litoralis]MQQ06992.1 hypothetical protein [Tritonibacter litoralis]